MKNPSIRIYKIIRNIVVSLLITFLAVYSALYLLLSVPAVQNYMKRIGENELSKLLNTEVTIGEIRIEPLNEVALSNVRIPDQKGNRMISVDKIGAGINLYRLLFNGKITFNHAEVIGLDGKIEKRTPGSPANIQFLIDALKPKDKNKPPTKFDIELNAVILRKSQITYDILSEPGKGEGIFDKNHIAVRQINSDIRIPELRNDFFTFDIRRFTFVEKSGFAVNNLTAGIHIDKQNARISGLMLTLPNSLLSPADISLRFSDLKNLKNEFKTIPLKFEIKENTVSLQDFKAFVPAFGKVDVPLQLTCFADGKLGNLHLRNLEVHTGRNWLTVKTSAEISGLDNPDSLSVHIPGILLDARTAETAAWIKSTANIPPAAAKTLSEIQYLSINGEFDYARKKARYAGSISSGLGFLSTNGTLTFDGKRKNFTGLLKSDRLQLGKLSGDSRTLGDAAFDVKADMTFVGKKPAGSVAGNIGFIEVKGYRYENIATDLKLSANSYEGFLTLHDPNADVDISGLAVLDGADSKFDIKASIGKANLHKLNLIKKYPEHKLGVNAAISFTGNSIDNAEGDILVSGIGFTDDDGNGITVDHFDITSRHKEDSKYLTVNSDLINGYIDGNFNFANIVSEIKTILATSFPSLIEGDETPGNTRKNGDFPQNAFSYFFRLAESDKLTSFFNLPITIVHPVSITGRIDAPARKLSFGLEAPYIMQKQKIIEKTSIALNADGQSRLLTLNAATQLDNKNGNILLLLNGAAVNDRLDTDLEWRFDRKHDFSGKISLSSLLQRADDGNKYIADISVNPSKFVVNDTVWNIERSKITVAGKRISVNGVNVNRENQFIKADGTVSDSFDDKLALKLQDIDLGYVFETLNINHVVFGGNATGDFYASGLLTKTPDLNTSNLNVKNFSYHHAPLGEADICSYWDNESKGIIINADIHQQNGRESTVRGAVYPTRDSLAFKFDADHINVQILKPFMSAFTTDVKGEATGHAELFGTFKLINMKGRLFADNFRLRIDQTNTYYSVSDSIIMDPGLIRIADATIFDDYGNTAKLNGTIRHTYFKNAEFDFDVTNVKNMLCYNTTAKENPLWYGTIFGNGSAYITGKPGDIRIDVNMSAAPKSSFFFVLSDKEEAGEYSFVTFTDKRKQQEELLREENQPEFLKNLKRQEVQNSAKSDFRINLLINANPNVAITLVMDPEGGDYIRAKGNGNMRIEYASSDEIKMFGNYIVDEGRYNFTLQDIIIREFKIKQGASISFHGDPLSANVDLAATYSVNANLQDLDESFAQDKDLNRTLVPVNALLKLTGPISQPGISFDLEFPTLTQDVYRKVRSIVSTDDMMNQQIIYLLALNRFYTPEYMGTAGRSNELAAVASSTISSQLSNMLGQLSDNWTIAPNFHSEKGDFSDTEVELALSSRLLNNRLLLNGNFGYSDNAMNNNSFIGDFDIEYLLTKSGNIRLKAYNRYNDQNYYIRNALTTQGVGIVFKHDFDRLFKKDDKKRLKSDGAAQEDSLIQRRDSIATGNKRKPVTRE